MTHTAAPMFDLTGKTALVTGATSGLGLQVARALGTAGARLMLAGDDASALELAMAELQSAGIDARWVTADSTQSAGIDHLVAETLHRMGDIDILLNHAPPIRAPAIPLDLGSYLLLSQRVVQQSMMARRQGRIIHVAPLAGSGGNPDLLSRLQHQSARNAVAHLTQALAAEWGAHHITVNAICPNRVGHPLRPGAADACGAAAAAPSLAPDDAGLQGACLLFASVAGRHITGQCLTVDVGTPVA